MKVLFVRYIAGDQEESAIIILRLAKNLARAGTFIGNILTFLGEFYLQ